MDFTTQERTNWSAHSSHYIASHSNHFRLGQPVTITKYFHKNRKGNTEYPNEIPESSIEIDQHNFEFNAYSPVECEPIDGIITGYKSLSTKINYEISQDEIFKGDILASWIREPVYVVSATLAKKYYVKREWLQEWRGDI